MKIRFTVDQAAAIRRGVNTYGEQEWDVDVSALSQEDRDLLATTIKTCGQSITTLYGRSSHSVRADAPTAEALVAAILDAQARIAKEIADHRVKEDAELALTEREDAEALRTRRTHRTQSNPGYLAVDHGDGWRVLNYARGREAELVTRNSREWAAWLAEIEATNADEKAEAERKKAEKIAREKAGKSALAAWVREHGSELARLRLEEGYDCWVSAAHTDYGAGECARIAAGLESAELPAGYHYDSMEERRCPTLPEIAALRTVRERAGDDAEVELIYTTYTPEEDAEDYDVDREPVKRTELRITVTCPDGHEDTNDYLVPSA